MSEEQEKKEKPKATLIKHHKTEPAEQKQDKTEKKKVVVVKKKVAVKKPVPKAIPRAETPSKPEDSRAQESKENTRASAPPQTERTQPPVPSPQEDKPRPPARETSQTHTPERRYPQDQSRQGGSYNTGPRGDRNYQNRPSGQPYGNRDSSGGPRRTGPGNYPPRQGQSGYPPRQGPSGYPPRQGQSGYPPRQGQQGGYAGRPGSQGYSPRPGQSQYPPRPGQTKPGSGGRPFNRGGGDTPAPAVDNKPASKKFFKAKKKPVYTKNKREQVHEKDFQIKKKAAQKINPVPKSIDIMEVITVSELARKMNLKASELISKLMSLGMMVTINQQIDAETVELLVAEYDCKVNIVSLYDETIVESDKGSEEDLKPRPPIVTIMGHVDHGKTKLLDAIRHTDVVASEFGGITQHIGAYKVNLPQGSIMFLDTPGHEAFTLMRARGAQITDIVILVVAANDGVMPQTVEAINHAKAAGVPIIVAINKVDLPESNIDRVKQQLSEHGLISEEWGGSTLFNEISALKRQGIKELLDSILLQSEVLELKANYNCRAEGRIIESRVDHGRGIVSTVIIQRGTLKVGDAFIAGVYAGKVRAMFNDRGEKIEEASPATPVEVLGFTGIPNAGAPFQVTENEKIARQVGTKRQELEKQGEAKNVKKITLDNLYDSIQDGDIQELKVIIKGDVHGSVEALQTALEKLSTKEIKLTVIHASAGAIVENDINLASASNAIIIGFHVRPTPKALTLAEQEKVDIRKYNIIYDAVEDIRAAMEGLLAPEMHEEIRGTVEVREIFKVPKIGTIAGCYVTSGKVKRGSQVRLFREGIELFTGKLSSLKRFKEDAREVDTGYECGIGLENFNDIKAGDTIEVFEVLKVAKKLG